VPSVAIHPPKTPVHKGSHTIAKATIPNICKMPGPPAPFVPAPLPNIAKSELSPKDYSTTVKIEGNTVAIRGSTFESIGDMASKGTGGGLISANCHGPAKFIAPGSMTVKIEGKNVHLLGDSMLNNLGPSGSPPNTGATMMGADHADLSVETRCNEAKEAAEKQADQLQAQPGKTSDKPATVSVLSNTSGRLSSGTGGGFQLPMVNDLAKQWPSKFNHQCSELTAISKNISFHGLESVRGSVIKTIDVRAPGKGHKANHPPCDACAPLLQALGIIVC
jgi:uncharacterized Zn-binding protein involved in type VI secretion